MSEDETLFCDLNQPAEEIWHGNVKEKKMEVIDGYTIKYHAGGKSKWSKGKMVEGQPDGYWEWYRPDGSLKRSGYFDRGNPVGEWKTYDSKGNLHRTTRRD